MQLLIDGSVRVSQMDWTLDPCFYSEEMYSLLDLFALRNVKFALEILAVQCREGSRLYSGL